MSDVRSVCMQPDAPLSSLPGHGTCGLAVDWSSDQAGLDNLCVFFLCRQDLEATTLNLYRPFDA